ncbi:MAG: uracil-xanthine permease [Clostridia bacterium]|nr:uracil-xanthine permease [Clostridia bacterium]
MKLIYGVKDKPSFGKTIVFAFQQLLAILAATIAVPTIVGNEMSQSAALFGAGVGTLVYLLFTKFKSPVFLGSSFAFLGSMFAAFAGAASVTALGYLGLIVGAAFAGLVYVVIAIIVKFAGVNWINKIMPAVVIGPTVAIIGLSLAGNAVGDLFKGAVTSPVVEKVATLTEEGTAVVEEVTSQVQNANIYLCLICGLVTLAVTMISSVYGKKMMKLIPFIIGIAAGYAVAAILTAIGNSADIPALQIIDFSKFAAMEWLPDFSFLKAFSKESLAALKENPAYIGTIAVAYIPVAFVVFAEHIADHKNLSSIIESDLLTDPGLSRTLLGDGVGSIAGAFFGGCPNTTYGESVGCVAISGNASVVTILTTAILAIASAFIAPFTTLLATIPSCVMGGVCIALYGFIAVSGLKMIQNVDLGDNRNLFPVSVILIAGVGGMTLSFGKVTITEVACALILGILTNAILSCKKKD